MWSDQEEVGRRDAGSQHPPGRGAGDAQRYPQPKRAVLVLPGLVHTKTGARPVKGYKEEVREVAHVRGKTDRSRPIAGGKVREQTPGKG